jgi:plastocyanin
MNRRRVASLIVLAVACAVAIPSVAMGGARAASTHIVVLRDIRFNPAELTIRHGETVTWEWRDGSNEHNVTFNAFHSRTQTSGSYTLRFTRPGSFSYRCTLHIAEGMRGRIIVH